MFSVSSDSAFQKHVAKILQYIKIVFLISQHAQPLAFVNFVNFLKKKKKEKKKKEEEKKKTLKEIMVIKEHPWICPVFFPKKQSRTSYRIQKFQHGCLDLVTEQNI